MSPMAYAARLAMAAIHNEHSIKGIAPVPAGVYPEVRAHSVLMGHVQDIIAPTARRRRRHTLSR